MSLKLNSLSLLHPTTDPIMHHCLLQVVSLQSICVEIHFQSKYLHFDPILSHQRVRSQYAAGFNKRLMHRSALSIQVVWCFLWLFMASILRTSFCVYLFNNYQNFDAAFDTRNSFSLFCIHLNLKFKICFQARF